MKEFLKTYKDKLLLGIIFISYIFLLMNIGYIHSGITKFTNLLTPFVYGFILAYLLNPLLKFLEKTKPIKLIKKETTKRNVSIFLSYVILVSMLVVFFIFIIPDVWHSIKDIVKDFPKMLNSIETWADEKIPKNIPFINTDFEWAELLSENLQKFIDFLGKNIGDYTSKAVDITKSVTSTIIDIVLGVVISLYMLIQKDTFLRQAKKTLYALIPETKYNKIVAILSSLHTKVSQFLTVKLLDSFILGILCFIGLLFIGVGHKLPIATMIGIGNIIPYFGSFLATIPCIIIILAESPIKAVIFLIFVLILQWVDNNIISPKLMEDSMDLNAFWVIFALIVMTGLFGFTGIILGVPIFAVIYALIRDYINDKYEQKIRKNNENTNNNEA